jgi:hypothetical protein
MANKQTTAYTGTGVSSQKGGNKPGGGGKGEHGKARGEAKMPVPSKTTPAPTRKR